MLTKELRILPVDGLRRQLGEGRVVREERDALGHPRGDVRDEAARPRVQLHGVRGRLV